MRGALHTNPVGWGTPEQVAAACVISPQTVRTWMKRGQIASACHVKTRQLLVRWVDAEARAVEVHARRVA